MLRRISSAPALGILVALGMVLAGCGGAAPASPVGGSANGRTVTLSLRWESPGQPITRSVLIRSGTVVVAGERSLAKTDSEGIAAFDLAGGTLRWEHPLRAGNDPQAVLMRAPNLRVVAARDGVYLSAFSSTAPATDPIVGYSLTTGERLFPSEGKLDASRTDEELVGANRDGLVSSIGVVRSPVTGIVTRLKQVPGTVLGVAGQVALAWTSGLLTGYDLSTDVARWTTQLDARPNVVVLDEQRVVVAADSGWQVLDVTDGSARDLPVKGVVDSLNTFSACTTASFQSFPVGRFGNQVACDGEYVAVGRGGRLEVTGVATGKTVSIAACDPESAPFAVGDGLVVCSASAQGTISLRVLDAATGFLLGRYDDPHRAPAGIAVDHGSVVLSGGDGRLAVFAVTR